MPNRTTQALRLLAISVALLVFGGCARPQRGGSSGSLYQITRVEVAVGDDSCYAAPVIAGDSIAALVQFIVRPGGLWKRVGSTGLGGVHAELFSGRTRVLTFGATPDRQQLELWNPDGTHEARGASAAEIDEFLALVGLPAGTNAGLGHPVYNCPRRAP